MSAMTYHDTHDTSSGWLPLMEQSCNQITSVIRLLCSQLFFCTLGRHEGVWLFLTCSFLISGCAPVIWITLAGISYPGNKRIMSCVFCCLDCTSLRWVDLPVNAPTASILDGIVRDCWTFRASCWLRFYIDIRHSVFLPRDRACSPQLIGYFRHDLMPYPHKIGLWSHVSRPNLIFFVAIILRSHFRQFW